MPELAGIAWSDDGQLIAWSRDEILVLPANAAPEHVPPFAGRFILSVAARSRLEVVAITTDAAGGPPDATTNLYVDHTNDGGATWSDVRIASAPALNPHLAFGPDGFARIVLGVVRHGAPLPYLDESPDGAAWPPARRIESALLTGPFAMHGATIVAAAANPKNLPLRSEWVVKSTDAGGSFTRLAFGAPAPLTLNDLVEVGPLFAEPDGTFACVAIYASGERGAAEILLVEEDQVRAVGALNLPVADSSLAEVVGDTAIVAVAETLWRSEDLGATWSQINGSLPGAPLLVRFHDGITGAMEFRTATGSSVMTTQDGGATWTQVLTVP
jgi:hypothetical protein